MPEMKFEDEMKMLQEIVAKLEDEDTSLDDSLQLYEEGLKLSKKLKERLKAFENRVEELARQNDE